MISRHCKRHLAVNRSVSSGIRGARTWRSSMPQLIHKREVTPQVAEIDPRITEAAQNVSGVAQEVMR